ncbi:MAG: disulfide bond formation protein DsbD, partial [Cyclobacteriaceae bacterium]
MINPRYPFLILLLLAGTSLFGQVLEPAKWTVSLDPAEPEKGDTVSIVFDVKIDENWYLYSTDFDPNLGPMVTEFGFEPDESFELVGEVEPINHSKKYDTFWEGDITYFKKTGQFIQKAVIQK